MNALTDRKLRTAFWTALVLFFLGINASQTTKELSELLVVVLACFMIPKWREWPTFDRKLVSVLVLWIFGGIIGYYFYAPIKIPIEDTELLNFRWVLFFFGILVLAKFFMDWNRLFRVISIVFSFCFIVDFFIFMRDSGRTGGLLYNPINFANVIAPFILISWSYFLQSMTRKNFSIWSWLHAFCVVAGSGLVLATQTRGVVLVLFVLIVAVSLFYGMKIFMATTGGVVVAIVSVFALSSEFNSRMAEAFDSTKKDFSRETRLSFWKANFEIWQDHPFFGVGYGVNNYIFYDRLTPETKVLLERQPELKVTHAHNQYLQILAGGGIWGISCFFFFIGLLYKYLFDIRRRVLRDSAAFAWVLGLAAGFTCFLAAGLTEANFTVTKNRYILVFLAALIVALWHKTMSDKGETK